MRTATSTKLNPNTGKLHKKSSIILCMLLPENLQEKNPNKIIPFLFMNAQF